MGRVLVTFTLMNYQDVVAVELGHLTPDKIRQIAVQGVIDTGAARLVLPEGAARQIGLPDAGTASVRYADHRREDRPMVKDAFVQLLGRGGVFTAILESNRSDALIGAIVLEELDLVVDCLRHEVFPRDPKIIISEVE
jgi:predicted aspartyl protease